MTVKVQDIVAEEEVKDTTKSHGRFLLLGPAIVLLNFAQGLTAIVFTDLIVYRTCLVSLNINSTECAMLSENPDTPEAADLEAKVERYASMIVMTKTLMKGILPAIITLFFGSWSDRGGRKPLLLVVFSGFTSQFLMLSLMCNWPIGPWYLMFAMVPANIVGGSSAARLAANCYISDTTAEKDRMLQLSFIRIAILGGLILGRLTAPCIYQNYGYMYIFGTATACCASALAFIYIYTPETVKDTSKESLRGIFKISFVKELVNNSFMKQGNLQRSIVCLAIAILTLNILVYQGDQTTEFLFTRTRLNWNVENYSHFSAIDSVLRVIGLCGVMLRNHIPGVTDTFLGGLGIVSALGAAATKSLAWKSWHMYLAVCIGIFNEMTPSSMRSIISKFVPAPDVGRVFSLTSLLEILISMIGTPLYALIYSNYIPPIYPSPVHLLSSSFNVLLIVFVTCMAILIRKSRDPKTRVTILPRRNSNDNPNELQL